MQEKKKLTMPPPAVIVLAVIVLAAVATHIIPAGTFDRMTGADGRQVVDPESFHYVEPSPAEVSDVLLALPRGFAQTADMVCFLLLIGGGVAVVNRIGLLPAAVETLAGRCRGHGLRMIPVLMVTIALFDAVLGISELCLLYVPILLPLILRLGFDRLTALGVVLGASAAGTAAAMFNPFTVAVSQKIAGLPLYSGTGFRVAVFVALTAAAILYVMAYARKIRGRGEAASAVEESVEPAVLTGRQKLAAVYGLGALAFMVWNLLQGGWDMPEMSACFACIGIGCGLISGMKVGELCDVMLAGCADMVYGAILMALARGVSVVLTDGGILDSIVWYLAMGLKAVPAGAAVIGILVIVSALQLLIPSATGKAVVIMPILAPLAELTGFTRQTAVLAYQFGTGLTMHFWPTGGIMHGCCATAGVTYSKWVRFFAPLLAILFVLASAALLIAQVVGYGPF